MNGKIGTSSGFQGPRARRNRSRYKSTGNFIKNPGLKKFLKYFLLVMLLAILITVGLLIGSIYKFYIDTKPLTDKQLNTVNLSSKVYDSKGKEIATLTSVDNREWIKIEDVQKELTDSIVATEDKRFYKHNGVDYQGFFSAIIGKLTNPDDRARGASTITMQLIKNITGNKDYSIQRKLQEQWAAIQLEKKLKKNQILEKYINMINVGGNNHGVVTAAKLYFNKDLYKEKLTLAECACIAGITQLPNMLAPTNAENQKRNLEKQKNTLTIMLEEKMITQAEYDKAVNEKVKFYSEKKDDKENEKKEKGSDQSYFVDAVVNEVIDDMVNEKNINRQLAQEKVYNGGYKIYTTLDSELQKSFDKIYTDKNNFPTLNNSKNYTTQAAGIIIENKTGYIKALYGGYGKKTATLGFNRATELKRSPGSTFKPIAVYGPALGEKIITSTTVIDDSPSILDPQKPNEVAPYNYDKSVFLGLINVQLAIKKSQNVPAAKIYLNKLKKITSFKYLNDSGFNIPENTNIGYSFALGQGTETSPLLLAGAYTAFSRNGVYIKPTTYTKIVDNDGKVEFEKKDVKDREKKIYEPSAAFIMTDILKTVVTSGGTAAGLQIVNSKNQNIPVAVKTGTSENWIDKWIAGYTPYYTAAVWYGYEEPNKTLGSGLGNPTIQIFRKMMNSAHANLKQANFPSKPNDVTERQVCKYSGYLPTDACNNDLRSNNRGRFSIDITNNRNNRNNQDNQNNQNNQNNQQINSNILQNIQLEDIIIKGYFIKGTEPQNRCDVHIPVDICLVGTNQSGQAMIASNNCTQRVRVSLIKRRESYVIRSGVPYPQDWMFEYHENNVCNICTGGGFNIWDIFGNNNVINNNDTNNNDINND